MKDLRADLRIMARFVPDHASVLDIGCGEGELLYWLTTHKQIKGRGLELQSERVGHGIAQGLAVMQANAEEELAYFADQSMDRVILSRTLQAMHNPVEMLHHVTRIGKQAIVAIPNFGFYRNRAYLALKGRMPVTQTLRYEWYNTPNIHFCTILDFIELCAQENIRIIERVFHDASGKEKSFFDSDYLANLFAEQATFLIEAM